VLGDNIFHGQGFSTTLQRAVTQIDTDKGATIFGYPVSDPERYGVGEADEHGRLISIEEKPAQPRSNRAVTGLYLYDNDVVDIARGLRPSPRGELEITDLNLAYMHRGDARLIDLGRGFAWLDTGTHESMLEAGQYVAVLEHRQGVRIACLEEIALREDWITPEDTLRLGAAQARSRYGQYVMDVARQAGAAG
jgi:glucose-1-phosphate thymidylyltransferase